MKMRRGVLTGSEQPSLDGQTSWLLMSLVNIRSSWSSQLGGSWSSREEPGSQEVTPGPLPDEQKPAFLFFSHSLSLADMLACYQATNLLPSSTQQIQKFPIRVAGNPSPA